MKKLKILIQAFSYRFFREKPLRITTFLIILLLFSKLSLIGNESYLPHNSNNHSHSQTSSTEYNKGDIPVLQQQVITGLVIDERTGEVFPGVNILVKGTTLGVITGSDGKYSITVPDRNAILVFSFLGYTTQEIPLDGRSVIDVALQSETQELEEVVVIGYGTQKKVNVIGSITTVSEEQISSAPVSMLSNTLAGRLSGAIVQQGSGEPGNNASSILIRGNATLGNAAPLIVVDGIPDRDLNSIAPTDIESITVLKDASAAIYGARAANGVILVTTKRGQAGKPTFTYGFYQGLLSPTKLPEMCDAGTYAEMIREMQSYRNVAENNMLFSLEDIEKFKSGEYPWTHPNTNWFAEGLKNFSSISNHNLSVTGGTQGVTYYASFSSQDENGIYKNSASYYKRYNAKASVDAKINDYLSFGVDMNGSQGNAMYPTRGQGMVFQMLRRSKPTDPAFFPNGLPGPDIEYGDNPVVISGFDPGSDDRRTTRINTKLLMSLNIPGVEGLSLSAYYAYDKYFYVRKLFEKPFTLYSFDKAGYLAAGNTGKEDGSDFVIANFPKGQAPEPRLNDYYTDAQTQVFNIKLNYDKTFNDIHNISAFASMETSEYLSKGIQAFRRYFISDQLPYLFAGGTAAWTNNGSVSIDARVNYFGRLMYNLRETYLFQFSLRRDGSLRFSKESGRWGLFPSFLVGWRISNEDFWKNNISFIDYFKLKASFGQMGNDEVNAFQYLTSYAFSTGGIFGSSYSQSLAQSGTPNPFITWERANVFNFGWESTIFKKLTFNTDFFYQRRSDILVKRQASVPSYAGIQLPDENFGIVDSKGFELEFAYRDRSGNFMYEINPIISYAKNVIIEYDEPKRNVPWQVFTGHPLNSILLYKSAGIFRDEEHVNSLPHVPGARPGDIIIEDYDGDGKITSDDRVLFEKTADPKLTYGLGFNLNYKNWNLRGLIQGAGSTMRSIASDLQTGSVGNYFAYEAKDRWTPTNINASKPRAYEREEEYWRVNYMTDYNYQLGGYGRLKNIQLTYTLPRQLLSFIMVKEASLYISGANTLLLYNQNKILDPEARNMQEYPIMKTYTVGAKITF